MVVTCCRCGRVMRQLREDLFACDCGLGQLERVMRMQGFEVIAAKVNAGEGLTPDEARWLAQLVQLQHATLVLVQAELRRVRGIMSAPELSRERRLLDPDQVDESIAETLRRGVGL